VIENHGDGIKSRYTVKITVFTVIVNLGFSSSPMVYIICLFHTISHNSLPAGILAIRRKMIEPATPNNA